MSRARWLSFAVVTLFASLCMAAEADAQNTTNPPETTAAPTTAAATTSPPTTSAPTTQAATTTQAASTSPNDSDNWLLILIGIVIVIGIVAFFAGRARAQKANAQWRQQAAALLDELSDVGINLAAAQQSAIPVIAARTEGRLVQLNAQLSRLHQRGPSAVERNALVPVINASNTLHATLTQITLAPPGTPSPAAANVANDGALLDSTARSAKLSLLGVGTTA